MAKPKRKAAPLTEEQRRKIAANAGCDARTVKRWEEGQPTRALVTGRIEEAAMGLGWAR